MKLTELIRRMHDAPLSDLGLGNLAADRPLLMREFVAWVDARRPDDELSYYKMPYARMVKIANTLETRHLPPQPEASAADLLLTSMATRNAEEVRRAADLYVFLKAKAQSAAQQGHRAAWLSAGDTRKLGQDGSRTLTEQAQADGFTVKHHTDTQDRRVIAICW